MNAYTEYLAHISKKLHGGDTTEHTYRPALQDLLEAFDKGISAVNEPKRIKCGAPDFKVSRKTVPLGYVETKDLGTNLDEIEQGKGPHGEQFIRYRDGLPNWILTDYLEFRWFVKGKKRFTIRLASLDAKIKIIPIKDGDQKLSQLFQSFLNEPALTVATAKDLATSMAHMTRIVRAQIIESFKSEGEEQEGDSEGRWLHNWLEAFRVTLIPNLDEKQFADMFAQTLAYGLFTARVHTPANKGFTRELAAYSLPKTNPFLRQLFAEIVGVNIPDSIAWAVDDIVELLKHADMAEVLKDFGKGKGKEDPVVHFYETFLTAYDPKTRELRGVYYTPEPVVSFIVRSIDYLLRTRFDRPQGLADENTLILDPATGTATFLYVVIDQIFQKFSKQGGAWDDYVSSHLLPRIFGFELLMAPYAVAHLKLGMQLEETGYHFGSDQRLGIFLTNTLEEAAEKSELLFARWVADEANAAARIKRDEPILVVLGNPPYSNFGQMNRGKWILSLLEDYKHNLNEKKLNIDDDFIKFIRFAQWRIEKTGYGIMGLITNNVYLDGITHRRMRECLLKTFNEIFILNLHGNLRKKEKGPDGSNEENVFDIRQGVSIGLFIKQPNIKSCQVFHADLWGKRKAKYTWLQEHTVANTDFLPLAPSEPYNFFVPKDFSLTKEYQKGLSLKDIFLIGANGIKTDRDSLFFSDSREELTKRMRILFSPMGIEEPFRSQYRVENSSSYPLLERRPQMEFDEDSIRRCLYRPFDTRWLYYAVGITSRPAWDIMQHMLSKQALGLLTMRQYEYDVPEYCYFLATRTLTECRVFISNRGIANCFPLFLEPGTVSRGNSSVPFERTQNLSPGFLKALAKTLRLPQDNSTGLPVGITPFDIFNYAYAIFHSPVYRKRYAEFLKIDFPRLPLTSNLKQFRTLAAKGAELVALHLLESPELQDFITGFPEKGDNTIDKIQYEYKDNRVWINKKQYFSAVPRAVWDFYIGGYQVCETWLKNRKGHKLTYDDIQHYQKFVVALNETIRIMSEIDKTIPSWPIK